MLDAQLLRSLFTNTASVFNKSSSRLPIIRRVRGVSGAVHTTTSGTAMTCSSGEDVPRGIDFLFDSHRLNVAISRAQCLAVLVHSPRLLDANAPTLAVMHLIDGVCRLTEVASAIATVSRAQSVAVNVL